MEIERMRFFSPELNETVEAEPRFRPIVVVTSNSEKTLPDAFLRRCVYYNIDFPGAELLKHIVAARLSELPRGADLVDDAVVVFCHLRRLHLRKPPGTAELLDFVRALLARGLTPSNRLKRREDWRLEAVQTLLKTQDGPKDSGITGTVLGADQRERRLGARTRLMSAAATALPTSEQLDLFLDRIRRAEFKIGPDEIAGAQKVLLLAHAEADDGLAVRRLKTMLAPIVVKTPAQQQDFYRRFDAMIAEIAPAPADGQHVQASRTMGEPAVVSAAASTGNRSRRAVIAAAAATLLLAIAGEIWVFWPLPPPPPVPPSNKPSPTIADITAPIKPAAFVTTTLDRRAGYEVALVGVIVLPMLAFAGWMLWRWRRRVLWLERHSGVRDADPAVVRLPEKHQPLFPATDLTAIALDLRRHLRVQSRDLDVERTIPETLKAGGSFTPVWQTVPRSPSYLFLIEKESAHDHVAGILDRAVDRLVKESVAVERYHFRGDPRWLIGADKSRGIQPIADVAARYGDHRLVVFAGGDGFFEPLSNQLEPGVEQALTRWTPRAVLSTKPMQSWSWRELALRDRGGFDVATASHSGLRALAERAAAEPERPAELLEGVVVSMQVRPFIVSTTSRPTVERDKAQPFWRQRRSILRHPDALFLRRDNPAHLFGRADDIEQLILLCRKQSLVFLEGESGVGKSALLQSGLVPALKSDPELLPIYVESLIGADWERAPQRFLSAALWTALDDASRKILGITSAPAPDAVKAVLEAIPSRLRRSPLLILDQFDDYQTRHRERFLFRRIWLSPVRLADRNEFWRDLRELLVSDTIHLVVVTRTETAAGLTSVQFVEPAIYHLDRVGDARAGVIPSRTFTGTSGSYASHGLVGARRG
jgi:hypothetical protein